MMKFHAAIATGLATLYASGFAQDTKALRALSKQLQQTEHSLVVMNELKARKDADPQSVTALILSATEPSSESQDALDRRLRELQQELSVLHMETEIILGTSGAPDHRGASTSTPSTPHLRGMEPILRPQAQLSPRATQGTSGSPAPMLVTGLDPLVLAILNDHQRSPRSGAPSSMLPTPQPKAVVQADSASVPEAEQGAKPTQPITVKLSGYSAAPLLQARASYRAGLYTECLTILKNEIGSEADHLRSRAFTRLDRLAEAQNSLQLIIKREPESSLGKRAAEDLKFIRWTMKAKEQLDNTGGKGSGN